MDYNGKVIELNQINKKIKGQTVLNNVSLKAEKGKIYGIKGQNGAGKSMLLRIICGLATPDSGEVLVCGQDMVKQKVLPDKVGALVEAPGFINHYSGFKNLKLLASIRNEVGEERIQRAMDLVNLDPDNKKKVKAYSPGMRQKLGIAQAIMESPELLILDEPTNGLDRQSMIEFRVLLKALRHDGATIILACHDEEDISKLCDETWHMEDGKLTL